MEKKSTKIKKNDKKDDSKEVKKTVKKESSKTKKSSSFNSDSSKKTKITKIVKKKTTTASNKKVTTKRKTEKSKEIKKSVKKQTIKKSTVDKPTSSINNDSFSYYEFLRSYDVDDSPIKKQTQEERTKRLSDELYSIRSTDVWKSTIPEKKSITDDKDIDDRQFDKPYRIEKRSLFDDIERKRRKLSLHVDDVRFRKELEKERKLVEQRISYLQKDRKKYSDLNQKYFEESNNSLISPSVKRPVIYVPSEEEKERPRTYKTRTPITKKIKEAFSSLKLKLSYKRASIHEKRLYRQSLKRYEKRVKEKAHRENSFYLRSNPSSLLKGTGEGIVFVFIGILELLLYIPKKIISGISNKKYKTKDRLPSNRYRKQRYKPSLLERIGDNLYLFTIDSIYVLTYVPKKILLGIYLLIKYIIIGIKKFIVGIVFCFKKLFSFIISIALDIFEGCGFCIRKIGKFFTVKEKAHKEPKVVSKEHKTNKIHLDKQKIISFFKGLILVAASLIIIVFVWFYFTNPVNIPIDNIVEEKPKPNNSEEVIKEEYADDKYRDIYIESYNQAYDSDEYIGQLIFESGLIDEPIVQTTDNDYFLDIDYKTHQYFMGGTAFVDYDCNVYLDNNTTIYGHDYAKSVDPEQKLMFTPLHRLKDKSNYEENKVIYFVLKDRVETYEICYVYDVNIIEDQFHVQYLDKGEPIYYISNYSEEDFNTYLNAVEERKMYDTGNTIDFSDKLLTLQTCYEDNIDKLIVLAKRINVEYFKNPIN